LHLTTRVTSDPSLLIRGVWRQLHIIFSFPQPLNKTAQKLLNTASRLASVCGVGYGITKRGFLIFDRGFEGLGQGSLNKTEDTERYSDVLVIHHTLGINT